MLSEMENETSLGYDGFLKELKNTNLVTRLDRLRLREAYFNMREKDSVFKHLSALFEGESWLPVGKSEARLSKDGAKVIVQREEDSIHISIWNENGMLCFSKTVPI